MRPRPQRGPPDLQLIAGLLTALRRGPGQAREEWRGSNMEPSMKRPLEVKGRRSACGNRLLTSNLSNRLQDIDQRGEILLDGVPEYIEIDVVVGVDESVSHIDDVPPW